MKKIKSLEYNTLIWFIIKSGFSEMTFTTIVYNIKQDIWISIILGMVLGLIPLLIYEKIKEKKLLTYTSTITNIIILLGLLIIQISEFWILTNFTNSLFLPKTSPWIISLALIIPIGYASIKDIHVIGKVSLIIFFISFLFNIIIFVGLIGNIDLNDIKPILENKPKDIFYSSFLLIGYNISKLFFLTIITKNEITNYSKQANIITYLLTFVNIISTVLLTTCVFGINLTTLYEYPAFQILKRVNILGAIDRMENILSLESIFSNFIQIILIIYYEQKIIEKTFKTKQKTNKYIIIFICLLTIIVTNTFFQAYETGEYFFKNYLIYIFYLICIIIPLFIFLQSLNNKEPQKQYTQ